MQTTLAKWGNSQAVRIPREVCEQLGLNIGVRGELDYDAPNSTLTIRFEQSARKYQRRRKVTMAELMQGWNGGKIGEEWGGDDVGSETVG